VSEEADKHKQLPDAHPGIHHSYEAMQNNPPFPKRIQNKPPTQPKFDIIEELKNLYVKIPLMQATKDVPIYEKIIKFCFIKKPSKNK